MSNTVSHRLVRSLFVSTGTQRARHREHREATRREILAAAGRLLRERPYRDLTVEMVMGQTALSRTVFYRHFDDIPDLVLHLFIDVGQELREVGAKWAASAGAGYPGPAREGLAGIVDFFVEHGPLVRAIAEASAADEQIEAAYRGALEGFIQITAVAFDRLVADGRLNVPDTHALARAMTLMNEAYLLAEFGREPFGDRDVALATLETVWIRIGRPVEGIDD
jgi:TetR/AcrR family transcriptional regulator, ethionamide resistance regulator